MEIWRKSGAVWAQAGYTFFAPVELSAPMSPEHQYLRAQALGIDRSHLRSSKSRKIMCTPAYAALPPRITAPATRKKFGERRKLLNLLRCSCELSALRRGYEAEKH